MGKVFSHNYRTDVHLRVQDGKGGLTWLTLLGYLKSSNMSESVHRLRITDVVEATGLSKSTLIRYEAEGKIPKAKRDGRKWRFYSRIELEKIVSILKELELI